MAERQRQSNGGRLRRAGLGVALVVLIAVSIYGLWRLADRRSADERLAEIEAARVVPAAEDAAIIYRELSQDANATSLLDICPEFLEPPLFDQRLYEPWRREDAPELARFVEDHQYIIDKLMEASALEECRFPLTTDIAATFASVDYSSMRQWAFLLSFAANNDVAEGRIDGAMAKWRCILQMGRHLRQRPILMDFIVANSVQAIGLKRLMRFVVAEESSEADLKTIESMPLLVADGWTGQLRNIRAAEDLPKQKTLEKLSLSKRLRFRLHAYRFKKATNGLLDQSTHEEETAYLYFRTMASGRGLRIAIALKRHRIETGQWPGSLEEIAASLPELILTDPLNGGPFLYRRTDDTFELYSKGRNGIDEGGWSEPERSDDWPIWIRPAPAPVDSNAARRIMKELWAIYGDRGVTAPQADANAP